MFNRLFESAELINVLFGPKTPIAEVVSMLRDYCDEIALGVLSNYLESEAYTPGHALRAEQKQRFLDLWANMVFFVGTRIGKGKALRLCSAASETERRINPDGAALCLQVQDFFEGTKDHPLQSQRNVEDMLDLAFGVGVFDHTKRARGMPGADLAMCVRAAQHISSRVRF